MLYIYKLSDESWSQTLVAEVPEKIKSDNPKTTKFITKPTILGTYGTISLALKSSRMCLGVPAFILHPAIRMLLGNDPSKFGLPFSERATGRFFFGRRLS